MKAGTQLLPGFLAVIVLLVVVGGFALVEPALKTRMLRNCATTGYRACVARCR
jgi:hypothetical protein